MKIILHLGLVAAVTAALPVSAAQFKIGVHQFTLPDGFTIELVAGTNLVPRPVEADFDELGRLYVTDSSGSNEKPEKQLVEKPHRILRLEDTDGDGRFDQSIVFADKMMFPEGAMWRDGSLYVAAPPSIWKLTDTDNDGRADVRVEWMKAQTLTGCANDLHGPYAGPDGWIYWCKGAFARQTNMLANGREFVSRASHIFRARPDGTGLEPVMTGGMDNPVGLAFTPEGERILSGTFFQNPEGGKRDGLIHAVYGGVYGKPNDALDGHPRTGDLMPIMTHLGPAAPAGLMRYESEVFGKDYQNNLFVACFNLHKVVRCVLEPKGATHQTRDEDFLVSDNPDFHPTDVFEDADGSLIVIDTGGWYKLCCPTSQLPKPDVLGGIYRIRRDGAPRLEDPRGLKIEWTKLDPMQVFARLGDARPAVRRRAIQEVAARGVHSRGMFERALKIPSVEIRRNLVWALTRIDSPEARHLVREALTNRDESVRRAALESVSAWRDALSARAVQKLLRSDSAPEQALAAEVLGRLDYAGAVPDLLSVAGQATDRMLAHAVTYALIEIADPTATAIGLSSSNALTHRAALVALDQMPGGHLRPEQVTPLLASADPALQQTAAWIVAQHRDWGPALRSYFTQRLREPLNSAEQSELVRQIAPLAHEAGIQEMLATSLPPGTVPPSSQFVALRAMAQANLKEAPEAWSRELVRLLGTSQGALLRQAVATARACPAPKSEAEAFTTALWLVGKNSNEDATVRLNALAAAPRGLPAIDLPTFDFLLGQLAPTQSVTARSAAAGVLAKAQLSGEQLRALTEAVRSAGPLELPKLLGAFSRATNENLGLELIAALQTSKSLASLRPETVLPSLTNFPGTVQRRADELLASLHTDAAQQKAQVETLLAAAQGGDIRRGQGLFNSPKAACSSCHAIGYLGGNVGPDLTRIGQIRNERDLLEALLFPSASFVRSYEPMIVATKGGEEYSGVLRKDAADEVVLATGPGTEQRIARSDISDMRPGAVSVMPSGLVDQLTKSEIADLLAFLKATRW